MHFLFFAVICTASIALLFKYSDTKKMDILVVTAFNYLCAFTISVIVYLIRNKDRTSFQINSVSDLPILMGIVVGFFFLIAFLAYQRSVRESGPTLSGGFGKMGITLPLILSLLLWREKLTHLQWLGVVMSVTAIFLTYFSVKKGQKISFFLIILFFAAGISEFSNKVFQKYYDMNYKEIFLFFVFLSAFILCMILISIKKRKIKKDDVILGATVGIPNLFSSFFLILALDKIPASIAYPIYSAGGIFFIVLGSRLFFKEVLSIKTVIVMILIIISIILVL